MNERKGEKLMKFGPEWLRKNLSKEPSSHGSNSSSLSAKNRISTKFKPAEHKYKRDDLLSFYRGKEEPPEELKNVKAIFVPKSQMPIGLQFCPRRVRAKRSTPRTETVPTFEVRPPNRVWNREHSRPAVNYFQPRWLTESWRQNQTLNRGPETEEQWRNSRQDFQNNKLKWNEKYKDRKEFQRSYSNDPWMDDRHSPDDMLPEWANSEDLEETGTFDASGAFLPIIIDKNELKSEENNNIKSENIEENSERIETKIKEEEEENARALPSEETENLAGLTAAEDTATKAETLESKQEFMNVLFGMDDPSCSIEDYLNKLVQEDDIERNGSKAESSIDFNAINFSTESNLPNLSQQATYNNAVTPGLLPTNIRESPPTTIPFDNPDGWYYQDIQDITRGPYTSMEMLEFFKANYFNNCTLLRKGSCPHLMTFSRLFDLCGNILPFLLSDHITTSMFVSSPFLPPPANPHMLFHENNVQLNHSSVSNNASLPVKDFINAASISLERYNQQFSKLPKTGLTVHVNNMYVGGAMQFPMNHLLQPRPNISLPPYQQNSMMDPLPYPFNQYPPPPQEHHNTPNIPVQIDNMVCNDWAPPNHGQHNLSWMETPIPPKVDSYVPIPMPVSSHNAPIPNQEPPSILSHPHDDYLSGLANLSINANNNNSPQKSVCNAQTNVSTTVTNSTMWNNQINSQMEPFDYNVSVLAHRQKLLYDLTPQQQQQPFTSVEQPTYVVKEKTATATSVPENLSKADFEKFPFGSENIKHKPKETRNGDKKKPSDDKKSKAKDIGPKKSKIEALIKPLPDTTQNNQKKKQIQPTPHNVSTSIPWNIKDDNHNIEKSQITAKMFENNSNFNLPVNNIMMKFSNQPTYPVNKVTQTQSSQFPWANSKPLSSTNILSLAEIQAEEQFQLSKLEKSASTSRIFHSKNQKMWNNASENSSYASEGFWDTQSSKPKTSGASKTVSNNQLSGGLKPQQSVPKVEKATKILPKVNKDEPKDNKNNTSDENKSNGDKNNGEKPNDEKPDDEAVEKFKTWAKAELACMSHLIDVPAFVNFLHLVESPYELEDYVKFYLKDEKFSLDFSKDFVQRRSQMLFSKSRSIPCDDLCSPAPAFNPSVDKRDDSKNKNKKKKNKMLRIDSRILGFNATASENRFNIGNIDTP